MTDYTNQREISRQRSPIYELFMLIIFVLIGLFVGNFIALILVLPFLDFNLEAFQALVTDPTGHPSGRNIILVLQAVPSLGAFIIAPLYFMRKIARRHVQSLNPNPQVWLVPALICSFLIIAFMPFNALFIQWNNNMNLPDWLSGLERWMQEKETALKELTTFLTSFETLPQLLVGFVVIALIPAIGEELVFRGLLQPRVQKLTGNLHAAVWITGFIFSAIHFQFYGLIPRMLLGVLLGYLYVWSGNLWYPIIGHFTNNGFTLLMIYLYKNKTVDIDIESTATVPLGTALFSLLIVAVLVYALKQYYFKDRAPAYE